MRVVIVEDDPQVIDVLSLSFEMQWPDASVLSAPSGLEGISLVRFEGPDIVVLDVGLPDIDGFDVTAEIRRFSDVPIIMLTVRDSKEDILRGLELGADDYLTKPFSPSELVGRARAILRRGRGTLHGVDRALFPAGDRVVDFSREDVRVNGQNLELSPMGKHILLNLAKKGGSGLSKEDLLEAVSQGSPVIDPRYLALHIQNLQHQLERLPQASSLSIQETDASFKLMSDTE